MWLSIDAYRVMRGDPREKGSLEERNINVRAIVKCTFKNCDGACTGLIWLKIGTGGGRL